MTSREEKNKKYVEEINKEKTIKVTKIVLKSLAIIILIFTLIFLYAHFYEPMKFQTSEYLIKDSNIPDDFNGVKILHFTDLLYGSSIDQNYLNRISEEIKLINPNIVFFTGNIISKEYEITEDEIKKINNFFNSIPYTIGKYAVSGDADNHNFNLIIENTNFIHINNEVLSVYNGTNKINLIGINYNEEKEIKTDNNSFTITLINNYDEYNSYNINSNLVFAGHNLGGEIKLFGLPLLGNDKYLKNYYEENNSKIYISNGLGTLHHLRLMNKPSINVYRLYNK